jgi:hypothetical protein
MKRIYEFAIGLILSFICAIIIKEYSNPYPCQLSCIGCGSIAEMFWDNFLSIFFGLIMIVGFFLMFHSVVREEECKEVR